jgi:hypothetical protein
LSIFRVNILINNLKRKRLHYSIADRHKTFCYKQFCSLQYLLTDFLTKSYVINSKNDVRLLVVDYLSVGVDRLTPLIWREAERCHQQFTYCVLFTTPADRLLHKDLCYKL